MEAGRMDARNCITLQADSVGYPAVLRCCEIDARPPVITVQGNLDLLEGGIIGFFCSIRCPGDAILKVYDLARSLRSKDVTLIGGFQSAMEREFLDLVLRGSAKVIICPARGLGAMRIPANWRKPLSDGRLLLLSFFDGSISRATSGSAILRNAYVAALSHSLLIAHAEKGGKNEKLCMDVLARDKPVFTLASPDNERLMELGAVPVTADSPLPLLQTDYS